MFRVDCCTVGLSVIGAIQERILCMSLRFHTYLSQPAPTVHHAMTCYVLFGMKVIFGDAKILPVDDILHTTLNAVEALKYPVKMRPLSIDLNANARERKRASEKVRVCDVRGH